MRVGGRAGGLHRLQGTLDALRAAPYFAVKVTGTLFHTRDDLDTVPDMRVLRRDGTPLTNLLAAGAAGGISGDAVWGYRCGNGLLSAVAGGDIAVRTAATLVQSNKACT